MQLRDYARSILDADTLDGKLQPPPDDWTDTEPGSAELRTSPNRAARLAILPAPDVKVPRIAGMGDRSQRVRIIHAMANHELQAIELFAWALLAFPDAPREYRKGLLDILVEEQHHFRLYLARVRAHGSDFGDFGVTGYFWNRAAAIRSPLDFACTVGLTFESANLDFAREYAAAARAVDDVLTALAIDEIHSDEIRHVAFGWSWLKRWKEPDETMWAAYNKSVQWPLGPGRARGKTFDIQGRRASGLDEDFIRQLEATPFEQPGSVIPAKVPVAPESDSEKV